MTWGNEVPTEKEQIEERQRLFRIIKELVKWENTTNEDLFNQAQEDIIRLEEQIQLAYELPINYMVG